QLSAGNPTGCAVSAGTATRSGGTRFFSHEFARMNTNLNDLKRFSQKLAARSQQLPCYTSPFPSMLKKSCQLCICLLVPLLGNGIGFGFSNYPVTQLPNYPMLLAGAQAQPEDSASQFVQEILSRA